MLDRLERIIWYRWTPHACLIFMLGTSDVPWPICILATLMFVNMEGRLERLSTPTTGG